MSRYLRLALVGDPVAHSRSPQIHHAALEMTGLAGEYRALRVDLEGLIAVIEDLRRGALDGVNVTMPHKVAAYELCQTKTQLAAAGGSVNTLRARQEEVEGHSTDAQVLEIIYQEHGDSQTPLLVLGAGGSARAALAARGGRAAWVSARDVKKAEALVEQMGAKGVIRWGRGLPDALVVNATPLGMGGESLPDAVLTDPGAIVDLPYSTTPTPTEQLARVRDLPYVGGLEVLVRQAVASFEWWTGASVDWKTLAAAVRNG